MKFNSLITLSVAVLAVSLLASSAQALPGAADPDTAKAEYDPVTGGIVVSVNSVINWFVESATGSLTGPVAGSATLPLAGGILSDSDLRIGEGNLIDFSYTNVSLGAVAVTGLPLGDLSIFWTPSFGVDLISIDVPFATPDTGLDGDLDEDGDVDGTDFLIAQRAGGGDIPLVITNYGMSGGSTSTINAVPEPASLLLLLLGGLALGGARRRS